MGYSTENIPGCSSSGSCSQGSGILHYTHGDSQQTHLLKQGKNEAFAHTDLFPFPVLNIYFLNVQEEAPWVLVSVVGNVLVRKRTHRVLVLKSRDRALIRKRSGGILLQLKLVGSSILFN